MFRQLANRVGNANQILQLHPSQLITLMDEAWNSRANDTTTSPGNPKPPNHPDHRTDLPGLLNHILLQIHPNLSTSHNAVEEALAEAQRLITASAQISLPFPQTGPAARATQAFAAANAAFETMASPQRSASQTSAEFDAAAKDCETAAVEAHNEAQTASTQAQTVGAPQAVRNAARDAERQAQAAESAAQTLTARSPTASQAHTAALNSAAAAILSQNAATAATQFPTVQSLAQNAATKAASAATAAALAAIAAAGIPGVTGAAAAAGTPGAVAAGAAHFRYLRASAPMRGLRWDHLIYAYMIENTRIYDIFRLVFHELLHGEKLGTPTTPTQLWMRATEELFYRDPPSFSISTINSYIRPDLGGSRRNAYQRMFGMDLNHGTHDNKPYSYIKADAANNEFVATFEELLREVWIAIIHQSAVAAPNPTDDAKIADRAEKLHDMLITRRQNGNLSREEFVFVSMMSWFHLTVDSNLPIVVDLRAEAASPEERLFKIAQRVGLPAHGLSKSYFDVADAASAVLIAVETGIFNTPNTAPALYRPALANPFPDLMKTIIRHWSIITGRDMKAGKVAAM